MSKEYRFTTKVKEEVASRVHIICYDRIKLYDTQQSDFLTWALAICKMECEVKDRTIMANLKKSM